MDLHLSLASEDVVRRAKSPGVDSPLINVGFADSWGRVVDSRHSVRVVEPCEQLDQYIVRIVKSGWAVMEKQSEPELEPEERPTGPRPKKHKFSIEELRQLKKC